MFQNIGHAPNSCYIAAVIAAVWAQWDRFLKAVTTKVPQGDLSPEVHQRVLRTQRIINRIVAHLRAGRVVNARVIEILRTEMSALGFPPNRGQQDASCLYEHMMRLLKVPKLSMKVTFSHAGYPSMHDTKEETYRFVSVAVPESAAGLPSLLKETLLRGTLQVRRETVQGRRNVRARVERKIHPSPVEPLPILLSRYDNSLAKRRTPISLPVSHDVSELASFLNGQDRYVMRLRSVVCHIGNNLSSGHYVAYTREGNDWLRWDDLYKPGESDRTVESAAAGEDGMPQNNVWAEQITRDSYLVFYDLFIVRPQATAADTRTR